MLLTDKVILIVPSIQRYYYELEIQTGKGDCGKAHFAKRIGTRQSR